MTKQHIFQNDSWINVYGFHMSDTKYAWENIRKVENLIEVSSSEKLAQEIVMISDETSFSASKL